MQTHEKRNRRRIKTTLGVTGAIAGATLTGAAMLGAGPQHAQETVQARSTEFPFATLRGTQRMQLNVANVANPPEIANPPDTRPACRVLFRLFDSEGRVVATATSALEAGKTAQITADQPDTTNPPDGTPARIPGMRRKVKIAWCGRCSADTAIFPHSEAVEHLPASKILRLTEKGEIHLLETETGELFVCGNSLSTKNKLK